ncbi:MAG: hypothetical protein R2715_17495 [Ilumatobacteraceae bacterium]
MIDAIDAKVTVGPRARAATSGSRSFGHELDAALGARRTPARVSTDPAGRPLAQPTAECAEPAPDEVADEVETSEAGVPSPSDEQPSAVDPASDDPTITEGAAVAADHETDADLDEDPADLAVDPASDESVASALLASATVGGTGTNLATQTAVDSTDPVLPGSTPASPGVAGPSSSAAVSTSDEQAGDGAGAVRGPDGSPRPTSTTATSSPGAAQAVPAGAGMDDTADATDATDPSASSDGTAAAGAANTVPVTPSSPPQMPESAPETGDASIAATPQTAGASSPSSDPAGSADRDGDGGDERSSEERDVSSTARSARSTVAAHDAGIDHGGIQPTPSGDAAPTPSAAGTAAPTAAAPTPGAANVLRSENIRILREAAPNRELQRLAVDLDGARVSVSFARNEARVNVLSDPGSRLAGSWADDVARTLTTTLNQSEQSGAFRRDGERRRSGRHVPVEDEPDSSSAFSSRLGSIEGS